MPRADYFSSFAWLCVRVVLALVLILLILGLFTRPVAAVAALFLVSIIFGHLMQGALTAPAAMRDFATANFIVMIAVIIAAARGNRWSLDALWLGRRKQI